MSSYFFIQSREPLTDPRAEGDYQLIQSLANDGNDVSVILVQNGVIPARRETHIFSFDTLCCSKAKILTDIFSLRQREINIDQLKEGLTPINIDAVIEAMLAGHKVIWH